MLCELLIIMCLFFHGSLHAYTDPGTGAMIWQLLMAAGFGLLFYIKRIFRWFKRKPTQDADAQE